MNGVKLLSKSKSKEHHPSNQSTSSAGYSGVQKASKSSGSRLGAFYSAGPVLSLSRPVQAKMKVGHLGDPYEREADSVAERIMSGGRISSISGISSGGVGGIAQRQEEEEHEEEELIQAKELSISHPQKTEYSQFVSSPADRTLYLLSTGNQAVQRLPRSGALQAKLRIGQPGDVYEQEADRVAGAVMRMPEQEEEEEMLQAKPLAEEITPLVQRQVEPEEEEEELQAKATSGHLSEVTPHLESHIQTIRGGGQPLPESARAYFEPRFGRDFSQVRVHTDTQAAESTRAVNARSFTVGQDMVFGEGQYTFGTASGKKLLAHELTHVVQQTTIFGKSSFPKIEGLVIQRIAPAAAAPVVIWFGKALAATSIDALIDLAIATITGMPPPGFLAHVGNFFMNLIPGLGEAKKVKKAAKLFKVIDNIIDIVRTFKKLKVPGAGDLLKRMTKEADYFKDMIKVAKLSEAKGALGRLLGFLREAQIASKLEESGAKIVHVGKKINVGKKIVTEVDVVTEEAGKAVFTQIKAGKRAVLTSGSTKWDDFIKQVDRTVEAAEDIGAKVRYVVDDISDEARKYLTSKDIEIRLSGEVLK